MNIKSGIKYFAFVAIFFASASSNATIIASTDFDDKTTSGATASNLDWTLNGISDPLSLTATENLFLNSENKDMFAVDHNLKTEGSWSVDIDLNVLAINNIALSTVSLNAYIFSNNGLEQVNSRDLDLNLSLFSGASLLANVNELNIYADSGSVVQGQAVFFDMSGNTLFGGNDYFLRLTASSNGVNGNNAGFDNLSIEGLIQVVAPPIVSVPEPTLLALFGMTIILFGARRYK
jgi:hypothetical protein